MLLIVCPSCSTGYRVSAETLGYGGRSVRCVKCRTSWHATAEPSPRGEILDDTEDAWEAALRQAEAGQDDGPVADLADAPSILPPGVDAGDEGGSGGDPAQKRRPVDVEALARRARMVPGGAKKAKKPLPLVGLAFAGVAALLVALGVMRAEVVRLFPETAKLYAQVGLEVNLRGLVFEDIATRTETVDNVQVLIVEGRVQNVSGRSAEVPRLRLSLRDAGGRELTVWTATPARSMLGVGEALAFRSRLAAPTGEGRHVEVRFLTPADLGAAAR